MPLETRVESAAATLIDEVGLEETIARMAGLPIPLPAVVVTTVGELTFTDRRAFLKRLVREIGKSPLDQHTRRDSLCSVQETALVTLGTLTRACAARFSAISQFTVRRGLRYCASAQMTFRTLKHSVCYRWIFDYV